MTARTLLTILPALALAVGVGFAPAGARESGPYFGVQTSVGTVSPEYSKDVVNHCGGGRPAACDRGSIADELRNRTFSSSDSKTYGEGGAGVFAGYRVALGESGFFVSGDIEAMLNFGRKSGQLPGASDPDVETAGRNRLGEAWPDTWSFRNRAGYGVTVKFGGSPASFGNTVIYMLGGARIANTVFGVDYSGCAEEAAGQSAAACGAEAARSGSFRYDRLLKSWMAGAGVERQVSPKLGLRLEARYANYEKWTTSEFEDSAVTDVFNNLTASGLEFALGLVWYP